METRRGNSINITLRTCILNLTKLKSPASSSQMSLTSQIFCNRLADALPSLLISSFLIRSCHFQSSSYSFFLTRLGGLRSRYKPNLKLRKCQKSNPRLHGQQLRHTFHSANEKPQWLFNTNTSYIVCLVLFKLSGFLDFPIFANYNLVKGDAYFRM